MAPPPREPTRKTARREKQRRSRSRSAARRCVAPRDIPHFDWHEGMLIGPQDRYLVKRRLGEGTFGRVLLCKDTVAGRDVAIKVVKDDPDLRNHAEAEVEVLEDIQLIKSPHRKTCVHLYNTFLHERRHKCLVFERLGGDLRSLLKANKSLGLFLEDVRCLAKQLLQCVAFLHQADLAHTDLKCRNVMLRSQEWKSASHPRVADAEALRLVAPELVVIDFGSAVYSDERTAGVVCTRQYRPPEVVLGQAWNEKVDLWSAGCIIAMLYFGQRLFTVHEDVEHLAMMEKRLGKKVPKSMALASGVRGNGNRHGTVGSYFEIDGSLKWPKMATSEEACEHVRSLRPLGDAVELRHEVLLHLLLGLLEMDPSRRWSASVALHSVFFTHKLPPE